MSKNENIISEVDWGKTPDSVRKYLTSLTHEYRKNIQTEINEHISNNITNDFINGNYGVKYGINTGIKQTLVDKFKDNIKYIESATSSLYHIVLAREILRIDPNIEGDIIECGAYKGASTTNLSLVAKLVNRKLIVCDSFEGLPIGEEETVRIYPHIQTYGYYEKGMYAGRLDEVQANIEKYGSIENCIFYKGYFNETLKSLKNPIAFAFADVDLTSSLKDCIQYIWPLLNNCGYFYTDDSCDMTVVKIWFDDLWWKQRFGIDSPGYVGSGCGLPLDSKICSLGYSQKINNPSDSFNKIGWLKYH
jgi:O-methyltransferase